MKKIIISKGEKNMIKPYFTRKNFIKLAVAIFYSFTILFTGVCLDAGGGLVSKKNPIASPL